MWSLIRHVKRYWFGKWLRHAFCRSRENLEVARCGINKMGTNGNGPSAVRKTIVLLVRNNPPGSPLVCFWASVINIQGHWPGCMQKTSKMAVKWNLLCCWSRWKRNQGQPHITWKDTRCWSDGHGMVKHLSQGTGQRTMQRMDCPVC